MRLLLRILLLTSLSIRVAGQAPGPVNPASLPLAPPNVPAQAMTTNASRELPDTYKGRVLTVGSGGGFRGQETRYYLLDDGRLFRRKPGQLTYTFIGQQTAAKTKKVFWSVEDRAAIKTTAYNKPGNIYRFVRWKQGGDEYRVTWGPDDRDVPAQYKQIYTGFMGMIPPASR